MNALILYGYYPRPFLACHKNASIWFLLLERFHAALDMAAHEAFRVVKTTIEIKAPTKAVLDSAFAIEISRLSSTQSASGEGAEKFGRMPKNRQYSFFGSSDIYVKTCLVCKEQNTSAITSEALKIRMRFTLDSEMCEMSANSPF